MALFKECDLHSLRVLKEDYFCSLYFKLRQYYSQESWATSTGNHEKASFSLDKTQITWTLLVNVFLQFQGPQKHCVFMVTITCNNTHTTENKRMDQYKDKYKRG